jgi:hypothetical protein
MFRALVSHPQEALHKRHLVYCVRVESVGCYQDWNGTGVGEVKKGAIINKNIVQQFGIKYYIRSIILLT